jgi:hypothetical protein
LYVVISNLIGESIHRYAYSKTILGRREGVFPGEEDIEIDLKGGDSIISGVILKDELTPLKEDGLVRIKDEGGKLVAISDVTIPLDDGINYRISHLQDGKYKLIISAQGVEEYEEVEIISGENTFNYNFGAKSKSIPAGLWTMVSLPREPKGEGVPDAVFEDISGEWLIYRWNPLEEDIPIYQKYRRPERISVGEGYWLRIENGATISVEGCLVNQNVDYEIPLYPGWNQIGSPFCFRVDLGETRIKVGEKMLTLDEARKGGVIEDRVWRYESAGYTPTQKLSPWIGCWIRAFKRCTLLVPPSVNFDRDESPSSILLANADGKKERWWMRLTAECGKIKDSYNFIGVSQDASNGYDRLDFFEPPTISPYISLYFPHFDWIKNQGAYTTDFKKVVDDGMNTWMFVVQSDVPNDWVTIEWESLPFVDGFKVWLLDEVEGKWIDTSKRSSYKFKTGPSGCIRRFIIKAGFGPIRKELKFKRVFNYPNPWFGKTEYTTIRCELMTDDAEVKVKIYDIAGERVRVERMSPNGYIDDAYIYEYRWDGRNEVEEEVANGVYLFLIEAKSGGKKIYKTGKMALIR